MWQKQFEEHGSDEFTIVGLALDSEGVGPAREYYDQFGVKFPSLVDPNYATKFGAVPKTFFIDEHGVILPARNWENRLAKLGALKPVTPEIRKQFTKSNARLASEAIADFVRQNKKSPRDLSIATELASRYNELGLHSDANRIIQAAVADIDLRRVVLDSSNENTNEKVPNSSVVLLSQAYLQLSRSCVDDRTSQVEYATLSFYLNPTIGFGKQIARIIAPEKFDGRADGSFDNVFREDTLKRLKNQRTEWLKNESPP